MSASVERGAREDRSSVGETDRRALEADLRAVVRGEVLFDGATRAIYATDSSNYRQVPLGVICPLDEADLRSALVVCARYGAPVLGRGAGTSLAGQACNVAVVFDLSRHFTKILSLDPVSRTARVQPGVVLDDLNAAARALDLTFGPDPATHAWCTLGGMVGNNSCGVHGIMAGMTVDHVDELVAVTYRNERLVLGPLDGMDPASAHHRVVRDLLAVRDTYADEIATGYPGLSRRVSGYNLDQLLEEKGVHLARALVGSESTCALVTEMTVSLSPWPKVRVLVVLGYADIYQAADAVPELLTHDVMGLEGFDERLTQQMRDASMFVENLAMLPEGGGWLLVVFGGASVDEALSKATRLRESVGSGVSAVVLTDPTDQARVWQVRESGLGATARPPGQPVNYEGWEDAAVQPRHLGTYLRGIRALWDEYGYDGAWYGHFGQGCVHTRNNFDFATPEGRAKFRSYVERAAALCVSLGGSISGEHGDGQARGELLATMYAPRMIEAFRAFKATWDPDLKMNPGKLIDAFPLDVNLHYGADHRTSNLTIRGFALSKDGGSLQQAVERCVGVGKCRSDLAGVMCPSYRVTRDEKHSTRGRAKLFAEMFQGEVVPETWRNEEVKEALDLCLSCKGCAVDCPTHVDMGTYKSQFLHEYYRGRLRPRSAYALGLLPWVGRLASRLAGVTNAVLRSPLRGGLMASVGLTSNRPAPHFARRSWRRQSHPPVSAPTVVVWPDTFTDLFTPRRGDATVAVLERLGERVAVPTQWACCGRTLYDSGMLTRARATATHLLDVLEPYLDAGTPIVVPEPSCLAAFRDEIPELLFGDVRSSRLAALSMSLAEYLVSRDWRPVSGEDRGPVSLHPHCHQRATGGSAADAEVLRRVGYDVTILDVGCCGLAGSFGYERDHEPLSRAIAADRFVPAMHSSAARGPVVLDGFSCQLQSDQLAGVTTTTLATLLDKIVN